MLTGLLCWAVVSSLHRCAQDSPKPAWWGGYLLEEGLRTTWSAFWPDDCVPLEPKGAAVWAWLTSEKGRVMELLGGETVGEEDLGFGTLWPLSTG